METVKRSLHVWIICEPSKPTNYNTLEIHNFLSMWWAWLVHPNPTLTCPWLHHFIHWHPLPAGPGLGSLFRGTLGSHFRHEWLCASHVLGIAFIMHPKTGFYKHTFGHCDWVAKSWSGLGCQERAALVINYTGGRIKILRVWNLIGKWWGMQSGKRVVLVLGHPRPSIGPSWSPSLGPNRSVHFLGPTKWKYPVNAYNIKEEKCCSKNLESM